MTYTLQSFLEKFKPYAINDMKSSGILASLTGAQGIIESNKGNSGLTVQCNNLFGIKGKYNGQSGKFWTTEYENGVKKRVLADFRKYPSWQESVGDHSSLFNRLDRYKNLRGCQDFEEACVNVKKDGYATAPDYTQTLMNAIKKNKLWLWDYEVLRDYPAGSLKTIRQGSDGGGVYLLQMLLVKNSFDIDCDGNFGGQTAYALKCYQEKNGLVADSICGPKTWARIKT